MAAPCPLTSPGSHDEGGGEGGGERWPSTGGARPAGGAWRPAVALAVLSGLLGAVIPGAAGRAAADRHRLRALPGCQPGQRRVVNVSGRLPGLSLTAPITMISRCPGSGPTPPISA